METEQNPQLAENRKVSTEEIVERVLCAIGLVVAFPITLIATHYTHSLRILGGIFAAGMGLIGFGLIFAIMRILFLDQKGKLP